MLEMLLFSESGKSWTDSVEDMLLTSKFGGQQCKLNRHVLDSLAACPEDIYRHSSFVIMYLIIES